MIKHFNSLIDFSEHLLKAATTELFAVQKGLQLAAALIQDDAKNQIGHLQPAVGSFPEWEELADSTKEEKARLGYVFNDDYNPLYRTGELQNSIQTEINMPALEAIIGTKDPIGAFQEYGTRTIPPRPFIGTAAFKNGERIAQIFGMATLMGIAGGHVIAEDIGRKIGYHQEIKL